MSKNTAIRSRSRKRLDVQVSTDDPIGLLKLSLGYLRWLVKNQRGSSFSTFVNEFPYDHLGAGEVYKKVMAIILEAERGPTK